MEEDQLRASQWLGLSFTSARINRVVRHTRLAAVEELLSRIDEKGVREQVITSLLNSNLTGVDSTSTQDTQLATHDDRSASTHQLRKPGWHHDSSDDESYALVSPLDMMAAAVTAGTGSSYQSQGLQTSSPHYDQQSQTSSLGLIDEQLVSYFCTLPKICLTSYWTALF